MSEIDEILDYLEYISQQKRNISLVNSYQGVSISLEVNIVDVSRRRRDISVSTHLGQNISLLPATKILIHSDLFPKPIQAVVDSVDIHHRTAVLKNLVYPTSTKDGRKETRVQPKENLIARVIYQSKSEYTANVADISVEGISLLLDNGYTKPEQMLSPKASVQLKIRLPISGQSNHAELSFWATVSYINALEEQEGYRVGFMTFPSDQDKTILRRFIFDRQTEMFGEVGKETPKSKNSSIIT
jgi:hypothetical protein